MDTRLISLSDGTSMGDSVIIFKTNAPVAELKELERISNEVYLLGGDDVPIWANILQAKGFIFEYIDERQHISPYSCSSEWLEEKYSHVTEHYFIENQPN